MSYEITIQQESDIARCVREMSEHIAKLCAGAIAANAAHGRPSTVSLNIKIGRNKDDPFQIELTAQNKVKQADSGHSDVTSWDEPTLLQVYRMTEVPGQQRIPEAD